jgi:flagellum-specific peptidoglycan hydrolase FlgJ
MPSPGWTYPSLSSTGSVSKTTDFIAQVLPHATKAVAGTHLPVGFIIAQAIVEGRDDVLAKYNNLFGVKAFSEWKGKTVTLPADGQPAVKFRWYDSLEQCFQVQVDLLTCDYYSYAYRWLPNDVWRFILELQRGPKGNGKGYCTNAAYADLILSIMEDFHLMTPYELERARSLQRLQKAGILKPAKPEDVTKLVPKDELAVILCRVADALAKGVKI